MRYENVWTDGRRTVKSAKCPHPFWGPAYAAYRVRGDRYTPYPVTAGNCEWAHAANRAMARAAQENWIRKHWAR